MSEAIKKPGRQPESYTPKEMPEIMRMAEQAQREDAYPEEFILPDKSTKVPSGVKHYGPAYAIFSNEFAHLLDYAGQGYGFIFHDDGIWCKDRNYTIAEIFTGHATQPACMKLSEEEKTAFWHTMGFPSCRKYYADPASENYMGKAEMREAIKHALCTLGQPVIVPRDDMFTGSIVIGYKDDGDVLVHYRYLPYFMDMENNAQPKTAEFTDWYRADTKLFVAGKREKSMPLDEIYREGTRLIYTHLAENIRGGKKRYYDEWEAFLRMGKDEMIAEVKRTKTAPGGEHDPFEGEESGERVWRFICAAHENTWCIMAEARYYVMYFFRQMKEYYPGLKRGLDQLDKHFFYTQNIMGARYNKEVGDPIKPEVFAKKSVRRRMARCVRRFRRADARGLALTEKLLERMGT